MFWLMVDVALVVLHRLRGCSWQVESQEAAVVDFRHGDQPLSTDH